MVGLAWLRLLLGTAGALDSLLVVDAALFVLTALGAVRWTSLRARGNPLLWTLYAGYAWLPVAMLLQSLRDAASSSPANGRSAGRRSTRSAWDFSPACSSPW